MTDPFGTTALRERVIAAWTASPVRFREDANHEEDFALGGYRDRLIIELAQNAADAAAPERRGVLRLTLRDDDDQGPVLVAANTGTPLTSAGVASLATLRASAKTDDGSGAIGRFGVGFAAVLAVSDEPTVLSRTGGVRFSLADTADEVAEAARSVPALGEELRRRSGHVPVLRLPYATEGEPPIGFDTAIVLPLRDEGAADLVRRLLSEVDDALLIALPRLQRIEVEIDGVERTYADVEQRWDIRRREGVWTAEERGRLLADRPTEERARPSWSVVWAVPVNGDRLEDQGVRNVVHAPTPTDEPLALPALLLASLPLDPSRRHIAEGPLTDRLVELAAETYTELVRDRAEDGTDFLDLVPVGFAAGTVDAGLRSAILTRLAGTPLLRSTEDLAALLRPDRAVVLDRAPAALVAVLTSAVDGLVANGPRAVYDALGVQRIGFGDLVEELATVGAAHPPGWWRDCYTALGDELFHDPVTRDALAALPVPLVDGRVVRGARGLLLPADDDVPREALAVLGRYGLRVVHPDAAHDALLRLGAVAATPRALLDDGAVRAAVAEADEVDDPAEISAAVIALVAAAVEAGELTPGELPWLGELPISDADGGTAPAAELVLPGSPAESWFDPDDYVPVADSLVERFGDAALQALGVVRTLGLLVLADVDLDDLPDVLADLDGAEEWAEQAATADSIAGEIRAIRDLDLVRPDALPEVIALLTGEPELRRALLEPVRVMGADGTSHVVASYASWWFGEHLWLDGRPADPDAGPVLTALLGAPPEWAAATASEVRRAIGLISGIEDLDAFGVRQLLDRLNDTGATLDAAELIMVWHELGRLEMDPETVSPAEWVRVLDGSGSRVVAAQDAVVVDAPMWRQRTDLGDMIIGNEVIADLLDLRLASESAPGRVESPGTEHEVTAPVRSVLPAAPERWWEHDDLVVDGCSVDWWVDPEGRAHSATTTGLARALSWAADQWSRRHAVAAVLAEPDSLGAVLADLSYDEWQDQK